MMKPVTLLVLGAGDRGSTYSRLTAKTNPRARVVAVAELRPEHRRRLAALHDVGEEKVFATWAEALGQERLADAAVIALPDRLHLEPALAALDRGYHVLVEAPMDVTAEGCRSLARAAASAEGVVSVCHALRYSDYTQKLKVLADSGLIGEVQAVQSLVPVGYDHFAHAAVRGTWRLERDSGPALLTLGCQELDWLSYVVGKPCVAVSSFAELRHFRPEARPKGAADQCLQCQIERRCPYSALKNYLDRSMVGERGWPLNVVALDPTPQRVVEALVRSPYGRCVYSSDNDVVDTQLVSLRFQGGVLASLVMTAFAPQGLARTTLFGSLGQLSGDGRLIEHYDFLTDRSRTIDTSADDAALLGGHGGGDGRLLQAFVKAVATGDRSFNLSSPGAVLPAYATALAAEQARRTGAVVALEEG